MFKNLDGFKKVYEDKDKAVMQHAKGHTITVAMKALPATHRKQLMSLPMHKMAAGGKIEKYADGTEDAGENQQAPPIPVAPDQQAPQEDPNAPIPTGDPSPNTGGVTGSWEAPHGASGSWDEAPVSAQAPVDQSQPMAAPAQGSLNDMSPQSILALKERGIQGQAAAESDLSKKYANAEIAQQNDLKQAAERWDKSSADVVNNLKSSLEDVKNGKINPNHYMENRQTPQKVATAIGLFLGGLGSAFTHQGNPAMEMLNKQIDRDIDAQKTGLNNKMNIYHAYLDQYKNEAAAEGMARATQLAIYGSKIRQAAAESGSPLAKARADMASADIQQQIYPLVQHVNFLNQTDQINRDAKNAGQLSPLPPEKLVQHTGAPLEDQNKMYAEIKELQNINNIRQPSLEAFDKAAKEVRPLSGGTGTSLTAFVPGMESSAQKSFSGLANTTVQEIEGTARQAAFESIQKNYRPNFGDSDATIASKRSAWENYLKSKSAAPVSRGYNLDLQSFQSTANKQPMSSQYQPGQILYVKGQPVKILNSRGDFAPVNNAKSK